MKKNKKKSLKKEIDPLIPPEEAMTFKEDPDTIKEELDHLKRVKKEIIKLELELREKPAHFGSMDERLRWAMRGVDPHKAICVKHNRKLHLNVHWEIVCGDCIDDFISHETKIDENNWYDPEDKPLIRVIYRGGGSVAFIMVRDLER